MVFIPGMARSPPAHCALFPFTIPYKRNLKPVVDVGWLPEFRANETSKPTKP